MREVDLQPSGNLLGRPAVDPFAVTTVRLIPANEGSLPGPSDFTPSGIMYLALQALLDILAQLWVRH